MITLKVIKVKKFLLIGALLVIVFVSGCVTVNERFRLEPDGTLTLNSTAKVMDDIWQEFLEDSQQEGYSMSNFSLYWMKEFHYNGSLQYFNISKRDSNYIVSIVVRNFSSPYLKYSIEGCLLIWNYTVVLSEKNMSEDERAIMEWALEYDVIFELPEGSKVLDTNADYVGKNIEFVGISDKEYNVKQVVKWNLNGSQERYTLYLKAKLPWKYIFVMHLTEKKMQYVKLMGGIIFIPTIIVFWKKRRKVLIKP